MACVWPGFAACWLHALTRDMAIEKERKEKRGFFQFNYTKTICPRNSKPPTAANNKTAGTNRDRDRRYYERAIMPLVPAAGGKDDGSGVLLRDVRFGRAGTVSFESLPSEFRQNSVRNHQNSARILPEFVRNPEI